MEEVLHREFRGEITDTGCSASSALPEGFAVMDCWDCWVGEGLHSHYFSLEGFSILGSFLSFWDTG